MTIVCSKCKVRVDKENVTCSSPLCPLAITVTEEVLESEEFDSMFGPIAEQNDNMPSLATNPLASDFWMNTSISSWAKL